MMALPSWLGARGWILQFREVVFNAKIFFTLWLISTPAHIRCETSCLAAAKSGNND